MVGLVLADSTLDRRFDCNENLMSHFGGNSSPLSAPGSTS